jgi:hypothetical protein
VVAAGRCHRHHRSSQSWLSLTLAGVDFVQASEAVWSTMSTAMAQRQASPACVTILDRIERCECMVSDGWSTG